MNPNHLTKEVIKQVILCHEAYKLLQKEKSEAGSGILWNSEEEGKKWISGYHDLVKDTLTIDEFAELLLMEIKYGFLSGYIGGATMNPDGDTIIKIE